MKQYKIKWNDPINQYYNKTQISIKTFLSKEEAEEYAKKFYEPILIEYNINDQGFIEGNIIEYKIERRI